MSTTVVINEKGVLDEVNDRLRAVLQLVGIKTRARARASMKPQTVLGQKTDRKGQVITVWANNTPIGEPPRTRTGLIKQYINWAFDGEGAVVIGPEALANHTTECLAKMEFGDHPFMQPARDKTLDEMPAIWRAAVPG